MTLTKKALLGIAAIGLAGLTIAGALAAGNQGDCAGFCPKSGPCPACPQDCPDR